MNGLENAEHDLHDARFSLETAMELLDGINTDTQTQEADLKLVVENLRSIVTELDATMQKLTDVTKKIELE